MTQQGEYGQAVAALQGCLVVWLMLRLMTDCMPAVCVWLCAQELCLPYDLCAADLDEAEPLGTLLLVCYLFTALPQLLPRATLDFSCKLGDQQVCRLCAAQHCLLPGSRPVHCCTGH